MGGESKDGEESLIKTKRRDEIGAIEDNCEQEPNSSQKKRAKDGSEKRKI